MSLGSAWTVLVLAGLLEVAWAVGLKFTDGWTRPWPSAGTGLAMVLSFVLLARALRTIPLGTAYAVWTGIGVAGTVALGMVLFGEDKSALRLGSIALILVGIVGLRLAER